LTGPLDQCADGFLPSLVHPKRNDRAGYAKWLTTPNLPWEKLKFLPK